MAAPQILTALALLGGAAFVATAVMDEEPTVVERVIDGDTVDVRTGDQVTRVRLLNVDTPETVDPDREVECLGPAATAFLKSKLPVGTEVALEYDEERTDTFGRDLAAVYVEDVLINAEIARAGLGEPMRVEPNDRFYYDVEVAAHEAQIDGRGLYSPDLTCTLPAELVAWDDQVSELLAEQPTTGHGEQVFDEFDAALATLTAQGAAFELDPDAHAWRGFGEWNYTGRAAMDRARTATEERLRTAQSVADGERADEVARIAQEKRKAEESKRAAEEAARRAAEEAAREAAAQEARDAAARAAQESAATTTRESSGSTSSSGSASTGTGNLLDTYTGCRAYGPGGTSLDTKGRTYTKIDCVTKEPLGW